jgi:hypothetical protein
MPPGRRISAALIPTVLLHSNSKATSHHAHEWRFTSILHKRRISKYVVEPHKHTLANFKGCNLLQHMKGEMPAHL